MGEKKGDARGVDVEEERAIGVYFGRDEKWFERRHANFT